MAFEMYFSVFDCAYVVPAQHQGMCLCVIPSPSRNLSLFLSKTSALCSFFLFLFFSFYFYLSHWGAGFAELRGLFVHGGTRWSRGVVLLIDIYA